MQSVGPPNRYAPHANQQDWEEAQGRLCDEDRRNGNTPPGYWEEFGRALDRTFGKEEGK